MPTAILYRGLIITDMKISKRILGPDADQPDDDESRTRYGAAVAQEVTGPMSGKRRICWTALSIIFLVYIGILAGYLYYNW